MHKIHYTSTSLWKDVKYATMKFFSFRSSLVRIFTSQTLVLEAKRSCEVVWVFKTKNTVEKVSKHCSDGNFWLLFTWTRTHVFGYFLRKKFLWKQKRNSPSSTVKKRRREKFREENSREEFQTVVEDEKQTLVNGKLQRKKEETRHVDGDWTRSYLSLETEVTCRAIYGWKMTWNFPQFLDSVLSHNLEKQVKLNSITCSV